MDAYQADIPRSAEVFHHADHPWVGITANPFSGSRSNAQWVGELVAALERIGLRTDVFWDRSRLIATMAKPAAKAQCRCLIAAGGDGTIASLLNMRFDVPMTMYPLGTENLFAKQYGLTREPEAMARIIERMRLRTIDLGEADGKLFSLMVSAGFDADVATRLAVWRHERQATHGLRRVRHASYAIPILQSIAHYGFPTMRIVADGRGMVGDQMFVFNLPQYGGGLRFAPDADETDGLLDYVVVHARGPLRLGGFVLDVVRGRHGRRGDVLTGRAKKIEILAAHPAPLQTDGDASGQTPIHIEVRPAAARIIMA